MKTKTAYISRRMLALLLTLAMVLAIVPPIDVFAATQDSSSKQIVFDATSGGEYYHKPIVINETTMARFETRSGRYNILIKGEPFSVTVQKLTNVDITFNNVTVDRSKDTGTSIDISSGGANAGAAFLQASQDLKWTSGTNYYVPTCPFLIMDGADVVVSFVGQNVFRAAGNLWRIANSSATQLVRTSRDHYHGYAGIQVNYDSSLTIQGGNVEAWGAYQLKSIDAITNSADRIAKAKSRYITVYNNNNTADQAQDVHQDVSTTDYWAGNNAAGGAGIGGGTSYDCTVELQGNGGGGREYKWATPGNITINAGNIVAVGGFKSAGIGGGVNGAVSNGSITINGDPATSAANKTKVTAIGSFYAAGIGEGDSVPNAGSNKDFETLKYSIVINGGEVYAQGGYKASGIGTTDELTTSSQNNKLGLTSGLTITLSGGDITALSGEASDTNNATAAIGAGDGTDMADYSISIAEGTIVKAVSYSKYAISNVGTNASTAPQNVIDPNTYMYLAYYDRNGGVGSNSQRTFKLYQIRRTERGDFMLVVDHTKHVLNDAYTNHDSVYFGYDETDPQNKLLYVVDPNGKIISDSKTQCEIFYIVYNSQTQIYSAIGDGVDAEGKAIKVNLKDVSGYEKLGAEIETLKDTHDVSYYFAEPEMKSFTVPAGYTAVAMTLYHPDDFGGRYIFHVPINATNNVYAVIEKMSSGDSSGKIEAKFDSHFTMGTPLTPGSSAITPDKISSALTNLVVKSGTSTHLGTSGAEQVFVPGTKSYKIWLPAGTTQFSVTPSWSTTGSTVTIREGKGTNEPISSETTRTYDINADETVEIWIEKKDTDADSKIVYKLTVRVKAKYSITLKDPSKVYDGTAVIASYDKMGTVAPTETVYTTTVTEGEKGSSTPGTTEYPTIAPAFSAGNTEINVGYTDYSSTKVRYSYSTSMNNAGREITVTTKVSQINGKNVKVDDVVAKFTYDATSHSWDKQANSVSVTSKIGSTNYTFTISLTDTALQIKANNVQTATSLFNYSIATGNLITSNDRDTVVAQATTEATNEVAGKTPPAEATVTKNYTITTRTPATLTLGTTSTSVFKTTTQTVPVTVTASSSIKQVDTSGSTDVTSLLAKEKVEYTYDKVTLDGDGNVTSIIESLGTGAPSNAGSYRVTASVNATEFQASGERTFIISQRPITIIGIGNWRYYLSADDAKKEKIYIIPGADQGDGKFYSGEIRLDNVVEYADGHKDDVELVINESTGMYFADKVVGDLQDDKIVIEAAIKTDGVSANYTFAGYTSPDYSGGTDENKDGIYIFHVPGQITYEVDGAMFGYGQLGAYNGSDPETGSTWHKYYPVIDFSRLTNDTLHSYLKFPGDPRIEYHSPDNHSHAEYIYVRSVNEGEAEARYAVDITFGSMTFQYTKTIWNVNTLTYERVDGQKEGDLASVWVDPSVAFFAHGEALTNGDILIENRSNRAIEFTATVEINTHCVMIGYTSDIEFKDAELNKQHRVAARMIWGDTIKWSENDIEFDSTNSRNTGNVGYATTPEIEIDEAEDVVTTAGATLSTAAGYKIISIRLFGIPTSTETVGSVTISLVPTN